MTDRPPLFSDREGALLVASLILRSSAKVYTEEGVRGFIQTTNPKEAAEMEEAGMMGVVVGSMSVFTQGTLIAMADMIEALSKVDDAKYLEVVHKVYADLKAEQAA